MAADTLAQAPSLMETTLSSDVLQLTFGLLGEADLGAASRVCRCWNELLQQPTAWQRAAEKAGYAWETSQAPLEERVAAAGGWKAFLHKERKLDRLWSHPSNLRARLIASGHQHWVPAILMEPRTRQLVTCSYDGTVRFWDSADSPVPYCFSVLRAGGADGDDLIEGFSSISLSTPESEVPMLAAGSELGNIHIWEVWRPEDEDDANAYQAAAAAATARAAADGRASQPLRLPELEHDLPHASAGSTAAPALWEGSSSRYFPDVETDAMTQSLDGGMDGWARFPRPNFARKVECWSGTRDFVQSVLMLPGKRVVSGGDNGHVNLHAVGRGPETSHRFEGHTRAVMCLDSADGGRQLISGSVDHSVRLWDVDKAVCSRQILGHSRSVHCLTLGKAQPHGAPVLFTGSRDHSIKLWDMRSCSCQHTLLGHTGSVTCIGTDSWKLLSGGGYNRGADDDEVLAVDATLRCWDLRRLGDSRQPYLWERHAPSPQHIGSSSPHASPSLPHGDPVLSLQLMEDKVLTSHGGKRWTARIWDLEPASREACT